jgi:tetratricopeptide (TPR) repeat protein
MVEDDLDMKLLMKRLLVSSFVFVSVMAAGATVRVVTAQETDDPVKIEIYKRFYDNRDTNKSVAYRAAADYLAKYTKDKDQYVDFLQKWMAAYDRDERKRKLPGLINEKNFAEAYSTGAKILADEPNYLRAQIDLGYAGYIAASSRVETYTPDALNYARKAIQALEEGKVPSEWAPFKGKDDTLAYLYYAVGFMILKPNPDQAIDSLLKAASFESDIKKNPRTYYFLAAAYEAGPYKVQSAAFQQKYGNQPETPESKAALDKVNTLIDRMIDAYARAISAAGNDPATEQNRRDWQTAMTNYWKFRHGGSDAGMTEFIASALSRPLPAKPL